MRETLIVIVSGREESVTVVRNAVRRHSERQRRICYRGEEGGKRPFSVSVKDLYP